MINCKTSGKIFETYSVLQDGNSTSFSSGCPHCRMRCRHEKFEEYHYSSPDNIQEEVNYKEKYKEARTLPLCKVLEPSVYSYHGSGQIEDLESQVEKLNETVGRLLATLMIKRTMSLDEIKSILNEEFEITPLQDFK